MIRWPPVTHDAASTIQFQLQQSVTDDIEIWVISNIYAVARFDSGSNLFDTGIAYSPVVKLIVGI